jgi:alpha-L-fucosidase
MFKAEHYDPQAWARLFKDSGALYVIPVFEHHDGFQMYDSNLYDWTAVKMGPHRDLMGDLEKEVRARAAGSFQDTKTLDYTAEDFRFTTKANNLYAIELAWPTGSEAVIHSLSHEALKGKRIQAVTLLRSGAKLTYNLGPDGLLI